MSATNSLRCNMAGCLAGLSEENGVSAGTVWKIDGGQEK